MSSFRAWLTRPARITHARGVGAERSEVLERAVRGDRAAFDQLVSPHLLELRAVVRRMVAHPEDTDDLVQESLLRAFERIDSFRGEAKFSTWLCAIGTRKALDYLRKRKRWRLQAQLIGEHECRSDPAVFDALMQAVSGPDHRFDAHEHVAFCFTCVARTLAPDDMAALMLRDVGGHSTREAAQVLGVSSSVLRHRLAAARAHMQRSFEGLCTLVSKHGACWQCESLRRAHPEDKRGPVVPELGGDDEDADTKYRRRLKIVRDADVDRGPARALHDVAWRRVDHNEQVRAFQALLADRAPTGGDA